MITGLFISNFLLFKYVSHHHLRSTWYQVLHGCYRMFFHLLPMALFVKKHMQRGGALPVARGRERH